MFRRAMLSAVLLAGFGAGSAFAQGCDTSIAVVNNSGAQINELYFNPTANSNWGNDRLGQNVLAAGASANFRPGRGGRYDFKVVWESGQEAEIRNVDICSASRVIATRGRLTAE